MIMMMVIIMIMFFFFSSSYFNVHFDLTTLLKHMCS